MGPFLQNSMTATIKQTNVYACSGSTIRPVGLCEELRSDVNERYLQIHFL